MKKRILLMTLALVLVVGLSPVASTLAAVEPPEVTLELKPGESVSIEKTLTTPEIPPMPDVYFLCDTTGSMYYLIATVQANAHDIMDDILAVDPGARFGVGEYKDFPYDPFCFQHWQSITDDTAAVDTAIGEWMAYGGVDYPEGQFYALYRIATDPAIGWRAGSSRIVVWFGDAPAHDPVPDAFTGLGFDIDEAAVTDALVAAGIRVIAVSVTTGAPFVGYGLDYDPVWGATDYQAVVPGYVPGGTEGQATRIAAATGGVALFDVEPEDVVDAIMEGLTAVKTDVWATVEADPGLIVTFDPEVHLDVTSGTTVTFEETIRVACDVPCGSVLTALVTFWANSYPEEGEAIGEQSITVTVPCGDEGLTPGYWKNNADKWDAVSWGPTGYSPDDLFSDVFGVVITIRTGGRSTTTDPSLFQALGAQGGGLNALARQAVAGLLNAAHPDINYPVSESCVIAWTEAALTAGDPAEIESLKNRLEMWNELGGGIDMHGNPI